MKRDKILRSFLAVTLAASMTLSVPVMSFADETVEPVGGGIVHDGSGDNETIDNGGDSIRGDVPATEEGGEATPDERVTVTGGGEDLQAGQTATQDEKVLDTEVTQKTEYALETEGNDVVSVTINEVTDEKGGTGYEYGGTTHETKAAAEAALKADLDANNTLDYKEETKDVVAVEDVFYITDKDGEYISGTTADGQTTVERIEVSSANPEVQSVLVVKGTDGTIVKVNEREIVTGHFESVAGYHYGDQVYDSQEAAEAEAVKAVETVPGTTEGEVKYVYNQQEFDSPEAAEAAAKAAVTQELVSVFIEGQGENYVVDKDGNYLNTTTVYYLTTIVRDANGNIVYDQNGNMVTQQVEITKDLYDALSDGSLAGDNYSTEAVYMITDKDGNQVSVSESDFVEGNLQVTEIVGVTASVNGSSKLVSGEELAAVRTALGTNDNVVKNADGTYTVTVGEDSYVFAADSAESIGITETTGETPIAYSVAAGTIKQESHRKVSGPHDVQYDATLGAYYFYSDYYRSYQYVANSADVKDGKIAAGTDVYTLSDVRVGSNTKVTVDENGSYTVTEYETRTITDANGKRINNSNDFKKNADGTYSVKDGHNWYIVAGSSVTVSDTYQDGSAKKITIAKDATLTREKNKYDNVNANSINVTYNTVYGVKTESNYFVTVGENQVAVRDEDVQTVTTIKITDTATNRTYEVDEVAKKNIDSKKYTKVDNMYVVEGVDANGDGKADQYYFTADEWKVVTGKRVKITETTKLVYTVNDKYASSVKTLDVVSGQGDEQVNDTYTLNVKFWENQYIQQNGDATVELVTEGENAGKVKIVVPFTFSYDNLTDENADDQEDMVYYGSYIDFVDLADFGAAKTADITIKYVPTVTSEDTVTFSTIVTPGQEATSKITATLNEAGKKDTWYHHMDVEFKTSVVVDENADGTGGTTINATVDSVSVSYLSANSGNPHTIAFKKKSTSNFEFEGADRNLGNLSENSAITVTATIKYKYNGEDRSFVYEATVYPTKDEKLNACPGEGYYYGFDLVIPSNSLKSAIEQDIRENVTVQKGAVKQVEVEKTVDLFESKVLVTYSYAVDPNSSIKEMPAGLVLPQLPSSKAANPEELVSKYTPKNITERVSDPENGGYWIFTKWESNATEELEYTQYEIVGYWTFEKATEADSYKVRYEFVSGTTGRELDASILAEAPSDPAIYVSGQKYDETIAADFVADETTRAVTGGTWTFRGWKPMLKVSNALANLQVAMLDGDDEFGVNIGDKLPPAEDEYIYITPKSYGMDDDEFLEEIEYHAIGGELIFTGTWTYTASTPEGGGNGGGGGSTGGGGGSTGGGGNGGGSTTINEPQTPLADTPVDVPAEISITPEDVPLADTPAEISIEPEQTPLSDAPMMLDELPTPLAAAPALPKTGGLAAGTAMGMGGIITALGAMLRRRKDQ